MNATLLPPSPPTIQPLTNQPFAHVPALDALGDELRINVSHPERLASSLIGLVLLLDRHARRSTRWIEMLLGAAFLVRGIGGHCPLYDHLGKDTHHV